MQVFKDQLPNLTPNYFQFTDTPQLGPGSGPIKDTGLLGDLPDRAVSSEFSKKNQVFKEYPMFEESSQLKTYAGQALVGILQPSQFACLFFSRKNITEIQNLIKYNVYKASDNKYRIGNQDETELIIIMRSVYLQYAREPSDTRYYKQEFERLNRRVIEQLLPDLLSNITQHFYYLKDISTGIRPITLPVYTSQSGTKLTRSITDVLVGKTANEFNQQFSMKKQF
jgi:hypothetical protein